MIYDSSAQPQQVYAHKLFLAGVMHTICEKRLGEVYAHKLFVRDVCKKGWHINFLRAPEAAPINKENGPLAVGPSCKAWPHVRSTSGAGTRVGTAVLRKPGRATAKTFMQNKCMYFLLSLYVLSSAR